MADARAGMGEILHPSASVSIRGRPIHVWAENGRWQRRIYEDKLWPRGRKQGAGGRDIDSVSLRQLPRTSVSIRAICGRKMKDAKL